MLLDIRDLRVVFDTDSGVVRAVDGVDLSLAAGEILGVVGESGSGKSVTASSILGLIEPPGKISTGTIRFRNENLRTISRKRLRQVRGGEIAMVFQDPMTTLNPVMKVGGQISEALRLHHREMSKTDAWARSGELLKLVGVPTPEVRVRQYPHEFSGGMRQRVVIAMAIANSPQLLIADEPTTALDVTIQAQVLDLLRAAQAETQAATILITHDLGVVAEMADRVVVMYAGRVVEQAEVHDLFREPRHPYTAGLLASMPGMSDTEQLTPIPGVPPNMLNPPRGCHFAARCPLARDRCRMEDPQLREVEPGRYAACHFSEEFRHTDPRTLYTDAGATQ